MGMTSPTDEWGTPRWFFDELNEEFQFTIDACANRYNYLLPRYWTKEQDCKKQDWTGEVVFINPPYSQPNLEEIVPYCAAGQAWTVVAILPVNTSTRWFHKYIWDSNKEEPCPGVAVRFLKRRLAFVDPVSQRSAPRHDTMVVIWQKQW